MFTVSVVRSPFSEPTEVFSAPTEAAQVVLGCNTPHLCTHTKVAAGSPSPDTSWPWSQPASAQTSPAGHQEPPPLPRHTGLPLREFCSHWGCLLHKAAPTPDQAHRLPWTPHLPPNTATPAPLSHLSSLPHQQQEQPKPHQLALNKA